MNKKLLLFGLVFLVCLSSAFAVIDDPDFFVTHDNANISGSTEFEWVSSNDGTISGTTTGVTGVENEAFQFDGTNDKVTYGEVGVGVNTLTVCNYIKFDTLSWQAIAVNGNRASDRSWEFVLAADKLRYAYASSSGTAWQAVVDSTSASLFSTGNWYHLCARHDGTSINFFVDGVRVSETLSSGSNSTNTIRDPTNNFLTYGNDQGTFWGDIWQDNPVVYERALSDSEISDLYDALGNPYGGATPPAPVNLFSIQARNSYGNTSLSEFKVNLTVNSSTISARTTNLSVVYNETYDLSGNNRTGFNVGAEYTDGNFTFDGLTSYINLTDDYAWDNSEVTVCVYFQQNELGYDRGIVSKRLSGYSESWSLLLSSSNKIQFRVDADSTINAFSTNTYTNTTAPYVFCGIYNGDKQYVFADGVNDTASTYSNSGNLNAATSPLMVGKYFDNNRVLNGTIGWVKIWSEGLNSSQILEESQNESIYNWDNLIGFYPFQRITNSSTVDVESYKDGFYVTDSISSYSTATTPLTTYLAESQISLSAKELMTNNSLVGTFTIGAESYSANETINISAGDYNVTFTKSGYYPITQQITVNADSSQSFVITGVYDSILNITFYDLETNNTITNYSLNVANNSYSVDYNVVNSSSYEIPTLQNYQYDLTFTKSGYFTTSLSSTPTTNYTNVSQIVAEIGYIQINIFDLNTSAKMTTNVTLLVQNASTEVSYDIINGSGSINSLNQGQQYNLQFSAVGYETNNYVFTYTNQSIINLYMTQGDTDISFYAQDSASTPLQGVQVQIERFVNGSYQVISLGETDIIGIYVANLQTGLTHRITFTKDNYVTQSFITQLTEISYTVTMQTTSIFDVAQGLDKIRIAYSPQNNTLYPTTVPFEINISADDFNLVYYYAKLKYNGTVLVTDNNTDAQGGTLSFSYDLSAYNNTGYPVVLEYGYYTNEGVLVTQFHTYSVSSNENYAGSLLQLRDKMSQKLSILEKLAIFGFVFVLLMLAFSTLVGGVVNVVISAGLAFIVGWIVGINLIILGIIFVLSIFILLAYGSDRI